MPCKNWLAIRVIWERASVLWLCSDAASFVVGIAMPVDGGYTIP